MSNNLQFPIDSAEAVIEFVVKHLVKQGKPSINEAGMCLYRHYYDTEELSCAAGCLIPDEEYSPRMEDVIALAIPYLKISYPISLMAISIAQKIHDAAANLSQGASQPEWARALSECAMNIAHNERREVITRRYAEMFAKFVRAEGEELNV